MTNRIIITAGAVAMWLAMASPLAAATVDAEQPEAARLSRVRSNHPAIAAVMAEAAQRSPLFRTLVATIDATDGLVYVDDGVCGHGVSACLTLQVQVAGPNRLLRIFVNPRKSRNVCVLMTSIAHELQHAIEVLSEPNVRNFHAAYQLFGREGTANGGRFETAAALKIGFAVERQVCR